MLEKMFMAAVCAFPLETVGSCLSLFLPSSPVPVLCCLPSSFLPSSSRWCVGCGGVCVVALKVVLKCVLKVALKLVLKVVLR